MNGTETIAEAGPYSYTSPHDGNAHLLFRVSSSSLCACGESLIREPRWPNQFRRRSGHGRHDKIRVESTTSRQYAGGKTEGIMVAAGYP